MRITYVNQFLGSGGKREKSFSVQIHLRLALLRLQLLVFTIISAAIQIIRDCNYRKSLVCIEHYFLLISSCVWRQGWHKRFSIICLFLLVTGARSFHRLNDHAVSATRSLSCIYGKSCSFDAFIRWVGAPTGYRAHNWAIGMLTLPTEFIISGFKPEYDETWVQSIGLDV